MTDQSVFGIETTAGFFEKYRGDDRHIDVECISRSRLDEVATGLTTGADDPGALKVAAGIADAIAIRGGSELTGWQGRLHYSDALARAEVRLEVAGVADKVGG